LSNQRLILSEGLHAPAQARAWVAARLLDIPERLLDDALLLVSELVTNAVRHGRPEIEVSLVTANGRVRVEVRDTGDRLPVVPPGRPSIDRPTGRGLLIVAATARDWGVVQGADGAGKTVWAELADDAGA
jgi:anti-sigma regulatory factor (Ser/Thr protein kinase)